MINNMLKRLGMFMLLCVMSVCAAMADNSAMEGAIWVSLGEAKTGGVPVFRKEVVLSPKRVVKAVLYSSALGVYDVFVDGERMGEHQLKPGWTDYRKEIPYVEMDVTRLMKKGETHVVAAEVSNGWWSGGIARGVYGKAVKNALAAKLVVTYADGEVQTVCTDTTWKASDEGPLRMGDIYDGETYDARCSVAWRGVGFDDSAWQYAVQNTDKKGMLIPFEGPLVTIRDPKLWRVPQSVTVYEGTVPTDTRYGRINIVHQQPDLRKPLLLKKGQTVVIDFGQNMVGWIDFVAKGSAGTVLTWRFGEMLNYNGDEARLDQGPAGSVWTYNLRSAKATLTYTMKGEEKGEHYHPTSTFFGFRYVELTATEDVILNQVTGQVVGSDLKEWGHFACSNPDVNQLYSNVWWGQRGNFLSIPTDCPQRDERLGWTGDTQIFSVTALYNADVKDFYRKWMRDMRNSQREDGAYPCTAPYCTMWGYGGAAWGDAGVIVPWNVYVMTGDDQILHENYESMQAWMRHCADQHEEGWAHVGAETDFGDWLAYREVEKRYVSYAYYAHVAQLMQKVASVLGKEQDAAQYAALRRDIVAEFQRRYITDGEINTGKDTQTAYLLALHFDLLTPQQRPAAIAALRKNIIDNDYRLSTGFVGTGILMPTLTECGMTDLAYRLLLQRQNPSWLYSIDQGATTVWERWDSYTEETGFHKHPWNMNSFNHYAYGVVVEWFYSGILGIRPDETQPGFRHFILKPEFGGGLTWAKGGTMTPYGRIDVEWHQQKNGKILYQVNLPKGTTATLYGGEKTVRLTAGKHKCLLH